MSDWDGSYDDGLRSVSLQPGDVALISGFLATMLAAPLTNEQRYAVTAAHERILGGGDVPPDLPLAIAALVDVVVDGGGAKAIGTAALGLLEAVCGAGYVTNVETLRQSLDTIGPRLIVRSRGGADDGRAAVDGIDWYEPGGDVFYSLDATTGPILRNLIDDLKHANRYIERCIPAPTRNLFVGPPGVGKTSAAKYIGRELDMAVGLIRLDDIASPLIGATAKNLRACCEEIVRRGGIIFIDEFDSLGTRRDNTSPNVSDDSKKTTGAMLQLFDALPPEQIVIACANVVGAIDPASARRFKSHVHFGPPDDATRRSIGAYHWRKMSVADGALDRLVELTAGRSGDTTEKVAHEAARVSIRRETGLTSIDEITAADVVAANNAQPQEGKLAGGPSGVPAAAINAVLRSFAVLLADAMRGGKSESSGGIILP